MPIEDNNKQVLGLLAEIRDTIAIGNGHAAETAANTRNASQAAHRAAASLMAIKRDVFGIRIGDTGPNARLRSDPLTPSERRQVDEVKRRFRAKRLEDPHYPLLSVSRAVLRDAHTAGERNGYRKELSLNARASKEIKREDVGLPPF